MGHGNAKLASDLLSDIEFDFDIDLSEIFKFKKLEDFNYNIDDLNKWQSNFEDFDRINKCFSDEIWTSISSYKLNNEFIIRYNENLNWNLISIHQKLNDELINTYQNKINWLIISEKQILSENIIRKFKDKVNWKSISQYQNLNYDFIREFSDKVFWKKISRYQKLNEDFLNEFTNEVYWPNISIYQKINDIDKFKNKICYLKIANNNNLNEEKILKIYKNAQDLYIDGKLSKFNYDCFWNKIFYYQNIVFSKKTIVNYLHSIENNLKFFHINIYYINKILEIKYLTIKIMEYYKKNKII